MSKRDTEYLTAETRKLEALGFVLPTVNETICMPCRLGHHEQCSNGAPLHPHPRRGRKKVHASGYARLKAHRRRKQGVRIVTDDNEIGL